MIRRKIKGRDASGAPVGGCWGASPLMPVANGHSRGCPGPLPTGTVPTAAHSCLCPGSQEPQGNRSEVAMARHDRGSAHTCVHQPHAHRLAGPHGPREGDVPGQGALPAPWGSSLPRACSTRLQHRQSLNLTFRRARGRLVPVPLRHGSRRSTVALGPSVAGQRLPVPSGHRVQSRSPCPDRGVTPWPRPVWSLRPVWAVGQGRLFAPTRSPAARGHHQPLAGSPVACGPQLGGRGSPAQGLQHGGPRLRGRASLPASPCPPLRSSIPLSPVPWAQTLTGGRLTGDRLPPRRLAQAEPPPRRPPRG